MNDLAGKAPEIVPLYPRQQAIELVQSLPELAPIRLFEVLYPLWAIEVEGVQQQEVSYELLEKYIQRGIAEADLHSTAELASFFGLSPQLVEKVLNFLLALGHLIQTSQGLQLTEIGQRSLSTGKYYRDKQTKWKLYFDAFLLHALPQTHYEPCMRILSSYEAEQITNGRYNFQRLFKIGGPGWNNQAVLQLGQAQDRAHYNLPNEISNLQVTNVLPGFVYLPMYIIETRSHGPRPYYIICTHTPNMRDKFFEHIINTRLELEVLSALYAENTFDIYAFWNAWLYHNNLSTGQLVQLPNGIWQVILPPDLIRQQLDTRFTLASIGTYHFEDGYFIRLWCNDETLRQETVLELTISTIKRRPTSSTARDLQALLQRFANRLQVSAPTLSEARSYAQKKKLNAPLFI